jgi:hypothetical protein
VAGEIVSLDVEGALGLSIDTASDESVNSVRTSNESDEQAIFLGPVSALGVM